MDVTFGGSLLSELYGKLNGLLSVWKPDVDTVYQLVLCLTQHYAEKVGEQGGCNDTPLPDTV